MADTAFLIAPFGQGLDTDLDIWQLPQDAFSDIVNCHIRHGSIHKRNGYSRFGYMVHNPATSITGITAANPAVVTTGVAHNLIDGQSVLITNVTGMTEINNRLLTV